MQLYAAASLTIVDKVTPVSKQSLYSADGNDQYAPQYPYKSVQQNIVKVRFKFFVNLKIIPYYQTPALSKIAWALSPTLVPPPVDNTEENADLFYKPYYFASEDNADMFYKPYMKNSNHIDRDAEEYYLPYIGQWNEMSDPWLQYYDNTPMPTHPKTEKYEGPMASLSMGLYQGPIPTLDEGPDQFQELPKLSFGHRYKGPKYDIADVNDNEIFDVPKVFVKSFY